MYEFLDNFNNAASGEVRGRDLNPEGYQRILAEERGDYLHVVDASRHEQGLKPLNPQERDAFHTSDDPDEIARMRGELYNSLGEDAQEWLDNQRTVAANMDLANQMYQLRDEFEDPFSSIDGLVNSTRQICDKNGIDPVEVAQRYDIELDPDLQEKLTGTEDKAENTMSQNMAPPPEYTASVDTPSMGAP